MKNLESYMKNLYISLEGIDETLKDKIKNLEGYEINECCDCGCCDYDAGCCSCEPECDKCCEPTKQLVVHNQFGRFNSEQEITRELDSQPKVMTLYDIHSQFGRFTFTNDPKDGYVEPLYFGYKEYVTSNNVINRENGDMPMGQADPEKTEQLYDVATIQNHKIYKAVKEIVNTFDLKCPIVQTKINGEVQFYGVKQTGTNGEECSIKSSLEEVAKILGKLDSRSDVKWSQILDVSIDNVDDLYGFVITFVFNQDKVREQIKKEI